LSKIRKPSHRCVARVYGESGLWQQKVDQFGYIFCSAFLPEFRGANIGVS
jgi:hypothetical protein